ncbi:MAG: haloalkane dehalogenase [Saprospiraceae bacterium]|nr:haloalkane dehalogenase [Saprospiraceae bacterium]
MDYINTPEERFQELDDYPFDANYLTIQDGMRVHYIDEGPKDASEVILLMHGEPSWSYLYRTMIPPLVAAGFRCIAPDLIGFGKSSKPKKQEDYTYARHILWMQELLDHLNISGYTFFGQDWGGLIGLRLIANQPGAFSRIVVSNTMLPTGDHTPPEAFIKWQKFSQKVEQFPVEFVLQGATTTELPDEVLKAYRAPFPNDDYTAGAKIFPMLVPTTPDDPESQNNRDAWQNVLSKWTKPLLTLFGDKDPVTAGGDRVFHKLVPGAKGMPHTTIEGGGHFIQEDKGPELAGHIIEFIHNHPK